MFLEDDDYFGIVDISELNYLRFTYKGSKFQINI